MTVTNLAGGRNPGGSEYGAFVNLGVVALDEDHSYSGTIGVIMPHAKPGANTSAQIITWHLDTHCKTKIPTGGIILEETGVNRADQLLPGNVTAQTVLRLVSSNYLTGPFQQPFPPKTGPFN
jgi:hypothetical protein